MAGAAPIAGPKDLVHRMPLVAEDIVKEYLPMIKVTLTQVQDDGDDADDMELEGCAAIDALNDGA